MHWYFQELARKLKPTSLLYLDIANAENLETSVPSYFTKFAQYFANDPNSLPAYVCWNSPKAVRGIALHAGFECIEDILGTTFVFRRKNIKTLSEPMPG